MVAPTPNIRSRSRSSSTSKPRLRADVWAYIHASQTTPRDSAVEDITERLGSLSPGIHETLCTKIPKRPPESILLLSFIPSILFDFYYIFARCLFFCSFFFFSFTYSLRPRTLRFPRIQTVDCPPIHLCTNWEVPLC